MDVIGFRGEYQFLSNFYYTPLIWKGMLYPTVEHAFQASKTRDPAIKKKISYLTTPEQAKREGRLLKLREDWHKIRLPVMESLVRLKFENYEDLLQKLLLIDGEILEENTWGDTFWGTVNKKGKNHLGKILMKIRDEKLASGNSVV